MKKKTGFNRGGLPKGIIRTRLVNASRTTAAGSGLAVLTPVMGAPGLPAQMQDVIASLRSTATTYANPLQSSPVGAVESCPDPRIVRSQTPGDPYWYLFSTESPFNDHDRDAEGNLVRHYAPYYRSLDLVHWHYVGDLVTRRPAYASEQTFIFAPKPYYAYL